MTVASLVGRIGGISYLHIPARDPAVSAVFYRDVFGWALHGSPETSFSDGTGHVIGRWVTDQAVTGTNGLRPYIYVADVGQTLSAVVSSGGQIVGAPYLEGTLRVALFADPAGNALGVWQETAGSPDAS